MLDITELDHIVLNVADVDRSLRFYVGDLGLAGVRVDEYRRGEVPFPSVRISANTIVDLFPPKMHGAVDAGKANLNHFCLTTSNTIEEIRAHIDAIGARITEGPVSVFGARGEGTSYYITDPDGTTLELRTYR